MREFDRVCDCGCELEWIPNTLVMTSYPAQYHVRCTNCGKEMIARRTEEVEEARERFKGWAKDTPIVETTGICIVNSRSIKKLKI